MDDLIGRQAVIEVLNKLARDNFTLNDAFAFYLGALHDAADEIKVLPAAQPQRMRGKWIPDNLASGGYWVCTACKHPTEAFAADVLYKFCPFCGSEMRGEADEQP